PAAPSERAAPRVAVRPYGPWVGEYYVSVIQVAAPAPSERAAPRSLAHTQGDTPSPTRQGDTMRNPIRTWRERRAALAAVQDAAETVIRHEPTGRTVAE